MDRAIADIERDSLKPEFRCVFETVGPQGESYDTFEGRTVCPGHAIEAGWFILEEVRLRGNEPQLVRLGTTILDWSLELGWDERYGGIRWQRLAEARPAGANQGANT